MNVDFLREKPCCLGVVTGLSTARVLLKTCLRDFERQCQTRACNLIPCLVNDLQERYSQDTRTPFIKMPENKPKYRERKAAL